MNGYEICDVRDDELEACVQMIRAAFDTVAKAFGLTEHNCPTNAAFMKIERLLYDRDKGNKMYALNLDGVIAGFVQLENKDDGRYELKNIAVLPQLRHLGFGKILLDSAKEKVRQFGGNKISIGIIEENMLLKQWYEKNGFVHLGTKKFDHLPFTVGFMEATIDQH